MNYIMENREMIVLAAIGLILAVFLLVKLVQKIGLEKIRLTVYNLFIEAENSFKSGEGAEKMEYVVNIAKSTVPAPFNLFITENLLRNVIQSWFDLIKDLLDDGRLNGGK